MILKLIGDQVKRQPEFGDNFTTFQTMATVRAIVALVVRGRQKIPARLSLACAGRRGSG